MVLSRKLDDKEIQLKNQSQIFFQISGAGHEAILVAAGLTLKPGYDWFFPYYRDRALCLQLGVTPLEMLLAAVGAAPIPSTGGRQMPSHWGHRALNIVSGSSATGTQVLHAVGAAEAGVIYSRVAADLRIARSRFHGDEIVYTSLGEGATSEGEFWEALNTACTRQLPVLFLVEDNGYAISVPVEVQTPGGDISRLVRSFPGLHVDSVDGTDFFASLRAMRDGDRLRPRRARGRRSSTPASSGPYSHSLSDDEKLYKTPAEREAEARRDPIARFAEFLKTHGLATDRRLARRCSRTSSARSNEAALEALQAPKPAKEHGRRSGSTRRTSTRPSAAFDTPAQPEGKPDTMVGGDQPHAEGRDGAQPAHRRLRRGRRRRQPAGGARRRHRQGRRLQGDARPAAALRRRSRLQLADRRSQHHRPRRRHGDARPQAGGRDPVLRLHLAGDDADPRRDVDAALPLGQQLLVPDGDPRRRSAATCAAAGRITASRARASSRTARASASPIRRTRVDAAGLLRTAIRCDDPVLFLEHKHLYRQTYNKGEYPGKDFMIPFGKASLRPRRHRRAGRHLGRAGAALAAWRRSRPRSDGISVAVLDLRTIVPYDWEAIAAQVKRTSRVDHRPRGSADLRVRRRDRRAHRRRAVRASRRAGPAGRRARHAGRLQPRARGSDPAADRRHPQGDSRNREVLTTRRCGAPLVTAPRGTTCTKHCPRALAVALRSCLAPALPRALDARRPALGRRRAPADRAAGSGIRPASSSRPPASISSSIAAATRSTASTSSRRARGRSSRSAPKPGASSIRRRSPWRPNGTFVVADAPNSRERIQIFTPAGFRIGGFTLPAAAAAARHDRQHR